MAAAPGRRPPGTEIVPIEDSVEDEAERPLSLPTPQGPDCEEHDVAVPVRDIDDRRAPCQLRPVLELAGDEEGIGAGMEADHDARTLSPRVPDDGRIALLFGAAEVPSVGLKQGALAEVDGQGVRVPVGDRACRSRT